ncbi:MAG: CoA transferase [Thermodesulfobacteriota bacterium]|nr:CoA transferase [Thermodesulfobacteriota bacterium]
MRQPLEGVKVLELSTAGVGPFMGWTLAIWGAEVIRIESEKRPCISRVTLVYKDNKPGLNRCYLFPIMNWKKRSFGVNLDHPKGLELVKKLVVWCDIMTASYSPRVIRKWGLHYDEVKKIKPDIIMVQTSMQGTTGPNADSVGFGPMLKALVGFSHLTGWPDRLGTGPQGAYTDFTAPWFGVPALMAGLDYRRRTGKGIFIDLSQYEAGLHFIAPVIMDCLANKRIQNRCGNESTYAAPHGVYRCKGDDRWCAIGVFSDEEWEAFCSTLGHPEWTKEPRFATLRGRKENETELNRLVEEWTVNFTPEEVMEKLQTAGIAASVVADPVDIFDRDTHLKERDFWKVIDHREIGPFTYCRLPPILSKVPLETGPAPCLGEDNDYVCTEILGISDEEFAEMVADGVLECV